MKLFEHLDSRNSDTLRDIGRKLLNMPTSITLKLARMEYFAEHLLKPEPLRKLWNQLDATAQKAVTAAVHNDGEFNAAGFVAQFGALPERPKTRYLWDQEPVLFDLFVWDGLIPDEMLPLLAEIVPEPERFELTGSDAVADKRLVRILNWLGDVREEFEVELISAETERTGWTDLLSYLRLLEQGELKTTASGSLNARSVKKVRDVLVEGEFLPQLPDTLNESIRAFGLAQFAKQAGFTRGDSVSKLGREFLQSRDPHLLLEGFEAWTEEGGFDELSRIGAVKGMKSRKTHLTSPASRRTQIVEALSWCPTGVWIDINDFYRAVMIWHFDFDVENPEYYSNLGFGYRTGRYQGWDSAGDYWRAIKGLLINVVLWEYLATLGVVDIVYARPEDAYLPLEGDYDDEEYYSRYDGLSAFRINPLGAFLLGQADEYVASQPEVEALFEISAENSLTVTHPDSMTPDRQMLLEMIAELDSADVNRYQLTAFKLLDAVEQGYELDVIREFLQSNHSGALPEQTLALLEQLAKNQRAFKLGSKAVFIKIGNSKHMQLAMNDTVLSGLCKKIDAKTVVVANGSLSRFRKRLKELEFLMLK